MSDDHDRTVEFLQALFPELGPTALVELRGFAPGQKGPPRLRRWCESLDELQALCEEHRSNLDLYIGVAARRRRKGTKEDLAYTGALWADIDTAEAIERLARFQHRPSAEVRSGTGEHLHAYWLLREPASLETEAERGQFEQLNKGVSDFLSADHCWDASRVMRLPGSLNHKHDPAPEVRLVV